MCFQRRSAQQYVHLVKDGNACQCDLPCRCAVCPDAGPSAHCFSENCVGLLIHILLQKSTGVINREVSQSVTISAWHLNLVLCMNAVDPLNAYDRPLFLAVQSFVLQHAQQSRQASFQLFSAGWQKVPYLKLGWLDTSDFANSICTVSERAFSGQDIACQPNCI